MNIKVKRAAQIVRFTLISPEILLALCIVLLWVCDVGFLTELGTKVKGNEEIWKVLSALPIAFAASIFKSSQKLRAPLDSKSNKELYQWPAYYKLIDRVLVSFGIAVICCGMIFFIWIFRDSLEAEIVGAIYAVSLLVSGSTALLIFMAAQSLREVFERFGS